MDGNLQENEEDRTAIRRLQATIDETYPHGWFVAIDESHVVAAAADFHELLALLRKQGRNPRDTMVIEAGFKRPDYVTIFI